MSIDNVVSVHIGLYNGEGWYRWIWMWESTQECDEAWSKAPADFETNIEQLVQGINDFIEAATRNAKSEKSKAIFDITPELMKIGWEITILDHTTDEVAQEYKLIKKAQGKSTA